MAKPRRVGIIGASAEGGWARDAHVPAVRALGGLELAAVATNGRATADKAADAFGVPAFGSGLELIRDCDVDIITVATRVPDHRDLVLAALGAGKHVYCEWPLGRGTTEAKAMAEAARAAGVRVAIGLQVRGSPVVTRARELIASGRIGRILSMRAYSATAGFGPVVPEAYRYLEDPENFANLVTIQGAHTIDLAIAIAGGLAEFDAFATAQYPNVVASGTTQPRVTFDHLLLQGRFRRGGALSIEVAGGRPADTPFTLDVVGESGVLRLDGGSARGFQSGRLSATLDGAPLAVDEGELASLSDAAANVAGVYATLRDDIARGSSVVRGFDHAAKLTQLVSDVFASSNAGRRVKFGGWPEA